MKNYVKWIWVGCELELNIRCDFLTIAEVENIISQRKLKKLQIGRSLHTGEQT